MPNKHGTLDQRLMFAGMQHGTKIRNNINERFLFRMSARDSPYSISRRGGGLLFISIRLGGALKFLNFVIVYVISSTFRPDSLKK